MSPHRALGRSGFARFCPNSLECQSTLWDFHRTGWTPHYGNRHAARMVPRVRAGLSLGEFAVRVSTNLPDHLFAFSGLSWAYAQRRITISRWRSFPKVKPAIGLAAVDGTVALVQVNEEESGALGFSRNGRGGPMRQASGLEERGHLYETLPLEQREELLQCLLIAASRGGGGDDQGA